MKKQVLSLALSATMLASMLPKPAFAADNTTTFPDMPNDWSTQALQNAVNNGLLNGIDGKIAAGENLTRAQMAAIVTRAFGTNGKANISSFGDVNAGDWFYDAMASSVLMGAFQGDGVNLNPNANITRQEAFTVLARLFTLSGGDQSVLSSYTDGAQVADWAKDSMASMVAAGYVKGSDNMLNPRSSITRAEFAQVMDNLVKTYFADSRLNVNANGNAVLNKAGTLEGATISGDLIIGDGAAEGDVVLKDVTVSGRLLVRGGGTSTVTLEGNAKVGSIAVNKPTGAVRVKNNTQKSVNVNALSDNVVLTGDFSEVNANASQGTVTLTGADVATMNVAGTSAKVVVSEKSTVETMNVQGSASGAAVSVQSGTNVKTMNTAASKAVVTVNGTVNTMSVAGSDTTVKAEEGAKIEKITTSAAKTTVSGKGSVANFEAAKGSSGADITTDGTKVVNNGTGNVTTGNDKVIGSGSTGASKSDSTGTTTPGGSTGGGGGSVVVSSDVVVAPMADHAAANAIPSENLCSSYSASGTVNGDVHTVKITAKNVMNHTNAAGAEGHWVGFGIPAAKDNKYYAGFGSVPKDLGSPVSSIADRIYEVNGKKYNTVYFSGDTEKDYKNGAYVVVKNGDKTTTYNITFDVSFFKADVSVLTDIQVAPEKDSHKTAAALGLKAAPTGTTVTLSGETTTDKLEATGVAKQNVYLLYVFNVKSELIKQLGGTVTPNPTPLVDLSEGGKVDGAGSMNNAALLNIQIWDNDKSSFIKKTISMELKDAAGRVQDTVELTVDATGCTIKGRYSVQFKDDVNGNAIQNISVEDNGKVKSLPSDPSKKGFKFLGWYYSSAGKESAFTTETPVTANMTVYAKWEDLKLKSVETDFGEGVKAQVSEDGMSVVLSGTVPVDKLTYGGKKIFTKQAIKLTVNGDENKTADVKLTYTAETGEFSIASDSDTFDVDGTTYSVSANNLSIAKTDVTPKARVNGPAAPINKDDYDYAAAYGKAGVTFSGGSDAISYTVDAAKLAKFCVSENVNDIKALTHEIKGTNYLFVGIQFDTPTDIAGNATKAMRYINGKASTEEAFDLSVDGENAYQKNPMEYFTFGSYTAPEGDAATYAPVASAANKYEVITYWMGSDGAVLAVNFSTVTRTAPTNNN